MSEKKSVLLVDDEEGIRKVLGITLSDMGFRVHTADSGEQALSLFRETSPGLILTDIKMPGMGGLDLLRTIKKENPDAEVIMISGHGDIDLAIESLKYEASDFITKPISEDALAVALKRSMARIAMKDQLKKYTEKLEDLVEEKSRKLLAAERLAATGKTVTELSHTIKNITSGLKGGVFVLEKGISLEEKKYLTKGWEMIKGNVEKITNLSLDLLNYAKTADINYQMCDPNEPAKEALSLMTSRAEEKGVRIEAVLSQEGAPFCFDPDGILHCLLNLISNAIDACRAEDPQENRGENQAEKRQGKLILLETDVVNGWGIEYRITDNGSGMNSDVKEKIFTRFFSTKGTGGTGIGLMMTRNIVERHEGIIHAESVTGNGSTFTIRLPRKMECG